MQHFIFYYVVMFYYKLERHEISSIYNKRRFDYFLSLALFVTNSNVSYPTALTHCTSSILLLLSILS